MSNEFDLEKAKAGEPVEYLGSTEWEACKVLGASESSGNLLVVERITRNGFRLAYAKPDDLRMVPKKVRVRYRVALKKRADGGYYTMTEEEDYRTGQESARNFVCWLTDWTDAEIPSESA